MGNSESVVRNVDKRSSRREHKPMFQSAIVNYRMLTFAETGQQLEVEREQEAVALSVCVRKRPIFEHEQKQGEFDVATAGSRSLVLHDARLHPDMRNAFMNHNTFRFDRVFGEGCDNDDVYRDGVAPLVSDAAGGGNSTVMMYGQTGSGKTFTMVGGGGMPGILPRAMADIFKKKDEMKDDYEVNIKTYMLELCAHRTTLCCLLRLRLRLRLMLMLMLMLTTRVSPVPFLACVVTTTSCWTS